MKGGFLFFLIHTFNFYDLKSIVYYSEVFHEIGLQLKKLSPYSNTFILTHCNGSSGYIPTDKAYKYCNYYESGNPSFI
jgi:hypothetical protein